MESPELEKRPGNLDRSGLSIMKEKALKKTQFSWASPNMIWLGIMVSSDKWGIFFQRYLSSWGLHGIKSGNSLSPPAFTNWDCPGTSCGEDDKISSICNRNYRIWIHRFGFYCVELPFLVWLRLDLNKRSNRLVYRLLQVGTSRVVCTVRPFGKTLDIFNIK